MVKKNDNKPKTIIENCASSDLNKFTSEYISCDGVYRGNAIRAQTQTHSNHSSAQ